MKNIPPVDFTKDDKLQQKLFLYVLYFFILAVFSFDAWKQTKGISTAGLSDNFRAELLQELGLSHFVFEDDKRCSGNKPPYLGAVHSWNNGLYLAY